MQGLEDKRVVVAGGAIGIGAATAKRLAAEGAQVVIGDLNAEGARATAERHQVRGRDRRGRRLRHGGRCNL